MADSLQDISGIEHLSPKQIKAIMLLCDYDRNMTYRAIAKEVGVCYKTLYNWRTKDKHFMNVKKKASELLLEEKIDRVNRALLNGAMEGNARLIKLYYERLGLYKDRKEISGPDGGPIEVDPKAQLKKALDKVAEGVKKEDEDK